MLHDEEKTAVEQAWNRMVSAEQTMSRILQDPHLDKDVRTDMLVQKDKYRSMKSKLDAVLSHDEENQ